MSNLTNLLSIFALETKRVKDAADALISEMFPRSCLQLINEWENALGIDNTTDPISTRRSRVIAKIQATGGQSADYFYALAAALGYHKYPDTTAPYVQILNGQSLYPSFRADISVAGDHVYDNISGSSVSTWAVKGTLVESDSYLQSLFNLIKHAHTEIQFINA